jgi:hypothetical protein
MIAHLTTTHSSEPDKLRRQLVSALGPEHGRPGASDIAIRARAQIKAREAAAKPA